MSDRPTAPESTSAPLAIGGRPLTLEELAEVVRRRRPCQLAADARERVEAAHQVIARVAAGDEAVYGVNTGFGELARMRIVSDKLATLQTRLVLSHAAGTGEPLPDEVVRGMLLLRANTLAQGHSGVRPEVIDSLLALLAANVLPRVPSRGSVGASGDLAPLAHLALPLLGLGRVRVDGVEMAAEEGLERAGLRPLELGPKEGLALINGTQAMTSLLALAALDLSRLVRLADLLGALSTDALRGTDSAFDPRLHRLRPHAGQVASAGNLWRLLSDSEIRESHRDTSIDLRVQDPYSVRCMPQVHGAVRDALRDVEAKLAIELNAVTDNPLVFPGSGEDDPGEVVSGGNFHGAPMALAADLLTLAATDLASISERRIEKLTNSAFSGLPPFLVQEAGLNSGFMIAQVTAAALVAECRTLSHPASVDSIPTSADKEDHVSMGMGAALKLRQVVDHLLSVLAIELLAAGQGIDLLRPLRSSPPLESCHAMLRQEVAAWDEDREMAPDIEIARRLLAAEVGDLAAGLE